MISSLKCLRQTHGRTSLAAILLLAMTVPAKAEITSKAQTVVDNQSFRLNITTEADNCGLMLKEHWPDGEPVFALGATDAFSIDTKIIQNKHKIADWYAT